MSTAEATSRGRHRYTNLVLPTSPDDDEKLSYAWRSLPFLAAALCASAVCIIVAQVWMEIRDPIMVALPATRCSTLPTRPSACR